MELHCLVLWLVVMASVHAMPVNVTNTLCTGEEGDCEMLQLLRQIANNTYELANKQPVPLYSSCEDIRRMWPMSKSGYYQIIKHDKSLDYTYCNMDNACGSEGWISVASLDMTNPEENCPAEFELRSGDGVRACGRKASPSGSCASILFSARGMSYTEVCGRVVGYQYGTTDAVDSKFGSGHNDIDSHYVDGVSLTHGSSPRRHLWTFMSGFTEVMLGSTTCPCNTGSSTVVQDFIGENYYCESGNPSSGFTARFYAEDPLWDGNNCGGKESGCCAAPGIPWFHTKLNYHTTDDVELRVCADQPTRYEDVPVEQYEIFVK